MQIKGYENGVPMGSTLTASSRSGEDKVLKFTVLATKGTNDANLDRIQLIKGWVDDEGSLQEKIVNVVWSGERARDQNGNLPPVGNTVDIKTATYINDIGSVELIGSWVDKEFDANRGAVYYARVLQIPTPRWSTYDAVRHNLALLDDVPATIQERAWTSPIWYTP